VPCAAEARRWLRLLAMYPTMLREGFVDLARDYSETSGPLEVGAELPCRFHGRCALRTAFASECHAADLAGFVTSGRARLFLRHGHSAVDGLMVFYDTRRTLHTLRVRFKNAALLGMTGNELTYMPWMPAVKCFMRCFSTNIGQNITFFDCLYASAPVRPVSQVLLALCRKS